MYKLLLLILIAPAFISVDAQTVFPEVRNTHDSKKVVVWNEPQDVKGLVYMGPVPVTWEGSSIAKPKMTCVLVGGNVLYQKQNGSYVSYSSYKIDLALVMKILTSKEKLLVLEKHSIERGPLSFKNEPMGDYAKLSNARLQDEWVLVDGKIPGESIKTFIVTRANDYQMVLKTYQDERLINYIIQVN